ncbi:unnamed protein product [Malus baccata var. baccata]
MNCSKTVVFIWILYALLLYSFFQMAIRNSNSSLNSTSRSALYDQMGRDLAEHGPSLSLSDIFTIRGGSVAPVLKPTNPPIRVNVLYLSTQYSFPTLSEVNSSLYHFSMFHASHHISPVPVTSDEIKAEAAAFRNITEGFCPLKIILDRVVLTSMGVLLGCWQVTSGSDLITIREKLRIALPSRNKGRLSFARYSKNYSAACHYYHESGNQKYKSIVVVSEFFYHQLFWSFRENLHRRKIK